MHSFPRFPLTHPLYHVGTLNPRDKTTYSFEGDGLSVSPDPEAWSQIARLTGITFAATKRRPRFLDWHRLTPEHQATIHTWGLNAGWVSLQTLYRVEHEDDEFEETLYEIHEDREEAWSAALQYANDDPADASALLTEYRGIVGTAALRARLNHQIPTILVPTLLTTAFVEDELRWDGVYWDDIHDPERYSAPRAVINRTQLPSWQLIPVAYTSSKSEEEVL